uniref:Thiamine biosynthesis protein n=1 Tax=Corynoplastis japonica TaxID=700918 RepID=A0A1X9PTX3_9RHOD|nr:thiamine biosynthesis protein [Corynoplastis japonica]
MKHDSNITLLINGEPFICDTKFSLSELVNYLDFDINNIVIELNSDIISSEHFMTTFIQSGDIIEIITIVGGG